MILDCAKMEEKVSRLLLKRFAIKQKWSIWDTMWPHREHFASNHHYELANLRMFNTFAWPHTPTTSNAIFGRTNYGATWVSRGKEKTKPSKTKKKFRICLPSIRKFICGTIVVWQLRYGICEMVCSIMGEKDTNANKQHASHDNNGPTRCCSTNNRAQTGPRPVHMKL